MNYTIDGLGTVPSFKNGKKIVRVKGMPRLITRPDRARWMKACTNQLIAQRCSAGVPPAPQAREMGRERKTSNDGCFVSVMVEHATGRMADPDGMLSTLMDCLVKARIITDDSPRYVHALEIKWRRGEANKAHVRVEKMP